VVVIATGSENVPHVRYHIGKQCKFAYLELVNGSACLLVMEFVTGIRNELQSRLHILVPPLQILTHRMEQTTDKIWRCYILQSVSPIRGSESTGYYPFKKGTVESDEQHTLHHFCSMHQVLCGCIYITESHDQVLPQGKRTWSSIAAEHKHSC